MGSRRIESAVAGKTLAPSALPPLQGRGQSLPLSLPFRGGGPLAVSRKASGGEVTAAAGRGFGRGLFALRRDPISQRGEMGERRARGTSSEHTSLSPFPQNRNTAKTPYRSVVPPLQIETVRFDLRRTFRRNLPAATKGSCAVFRRMRTRLRPIGSPAGVYGGRGTEDVSLRRMRVFPLRRGMTSQALRASSPKGEPSFATPRAKWGRRCGGEVNTPAEKHFGQPFPSPYKDAGRMTRAKPGQIQQNAISSE